MLEPFRQTQVHIGRYFLQGCARIILHTKEVRYLEGTLSTEMREIGG